MPPSGGPRLVRCSVKRDVRIGGDIMDGEWRSSLREHDANVASLVDASPRAIQIAQQDRYVCDLRLVSPESRHHAVSNRVSECARQWIVLGSYSNLHSCLRGATHRTWTSVCMLKIKKISIERVGQNDTKISRLIVSFRASPRVFSIETMAKARTGEDLWFVVFLGVFGCWCFVVWVSFCVVESHYGGVAVRRH